MDHGSYNSSQALIISRRTRFLTIGLVTITIILVVLTIKSGRLINSSFRLKIYSTEQPKTSYFCMSLTKSVSLRSITPLTPLLILGTGLIFHTSDQKTAFTVLSYTLGTILLYS